MPKKQYIKTYMTTDATALSAISKVGHITSEQLNECGMSDKRIRNFVKQGYLEKVSYRNQSKQLDHCYKLTEAGRDFYDHRDGREHSYYQSVSPQHDITIADKYFSLGEHERSTWMTESEIRSEFLAHIEDLRNQGDVARADQLEDAYKSRDISAVDAVYETEEGIRIGYEVATNSYGHAELQAKAEFVQVMKLKYEPQRI